VLTLNHVMGPHETLSVYVEASFLNTTASLGLYGVTVQYATQATLAVPQ
jgi:hypothetical protein